MRIRFRLLRLMLIIALAPLVLVAVLNRISTFRMQSRIETIAFESSMRDASNYLQGLVNDYVRLVERDMALIEMTVLAQAKEVELRLATDPPDAPRMFLSQDYDAGRLPKDQAVYDEKFYRLGPDGKRHRRPVWFDEQVYVPVRGVNRAAMQRDMALLSTMPKAYRALYQFDPATKTWLYTAMDSGFHTSFPGHGGYPPEYDPRERSWYTDAQKTNQPEWTILPDVSTRTVSLTCSKAVYRPDGRFAGVTAIDVPLLSVLQELRPPVEWTSSAQSLHAFLDPAEGDRPIIFIQERYADQGLQWDRPTALEHLETDDPADLTALMRDVREGKGGVRRVGYRGRDMLWAYGVYGEKNMISVVMVPYGTVVEGARRADSAIRQIAAETLWGTGILTLCVIALVIVIALRHSRKLMRPIQQLSAGATQLSAGDFSSRVNIQTGDELEHLGDVFNDMGPMLREREKMKQSLALAMEIQQHLLPAGPPKVDGFDIVGKCLYSDETGGDYYDFIDLIEWGPGRVGIAVGDITGHGIGAALLMASARAVLRSHAVTHDDLGTMFADINVHLVRDTGEERFLTLFYGVLDGPGRTLRWSSGGHDPAIWRHGRSGEIEELEAAGMVLGVMENVEYKQSGPITLDAGDVIAIGTDGIWEAKNAAGDMFTRQRMIDLLAANAQQSAAEIYQAIVSAVVDFHSGAGPQEDDITLVVIKAL